MPAAAYLWYSRSLSMALFLAAAIFNALAVKTVKRLVAQPRPAASPEQGDYGMPSSHAASLFFFAIALPDSALKGETSATATTIATMGSLRVCLAILAGALSLHRVHGGYHTTPQVIPGGIWGAACAVAWNGIAADAYEFAASRQQIKRAGTTQTGMPMQAMLCAVILLVGALIVGSIERVLSKGRKA